MVRQRINGKIESLNSRLPSGEGGCVRYKRRDFTESIEELLCSSIRLRVRAPHFHGNLVKNDAEIDCHVSCVKEEPIGEMSKSRDGSELRWNESINPSVRPSIRASDFLFIHLSVTSSIYARSGSGGQVAAPRRPAPRRAGLSIPIDRWIDSALNERRDAQRR